MRSLAFDITSKVNSGFPGMILILEDKFGKSINSEICIYSQVESLYLPYRIFVNFIP